MSVKAYWGCLGSIFLLLLSFSSLKATTEADTLKTAEARRTTGKIEVDGNLIESDWQTAPAINGFRQTSPAEGEVPTESTTVKALYDDAAIYFGFWCYDKEPSRIIKQLTRRDRYTESDQVIVRIDSHHDHQTAYYFSVNVSGVLQDILLFNNISEDDSWDAVWEGRTKVYDWGWTAEFRIPYSALRFSKADEYTWGIDFARYIPRNQETDRWQFVPQHEMIGVSRYGHLTGIKNIEPPGRLETLPYAVSYAVTEPRSLGNPNGRDVESNIGADLKYGISSALTLDATINPDFGQVESDKSLVNLSTYETYFEEKRPFFLEGLDMFSTPFFTQFYSRRIGRQPQNGVDSALYYIDYPRNTTILEAMKITGKTDRGMSIAFLNATTQKEKTKFRTAADPGAPIHEAVVEPMANYTVARVKQDVLGNSYVGGLFTYANQKDSIDALSGSADYQVFFLKQMMMTNGVLARTDNGPDSSGTAAAFSLQKVGGRIFRGSAAFEYLDRKVDFNRLGYLDRNSIRSHSGWLQLRSNKQFSFFHYLRLNFNYWYSENLDNYSLSKGGNVNGNVYFTNNWQILAGVGGDGRVYDDRETRDGSLWLKPRAWNYWAGIGSDESKMLSFNFTYYHGKGRGGPYDGYEFGSEIRPATNLEFELETSYTALRHEDYWVGFSAEGYPAFGQISNDEMDVTLRGTYTFTRNLTLQTYTQFYFSAGQFDNFKKLTSPDAMEPVAIDSIAMYRPDFNYKALNLNLILRWEYRPGSTIYVVWTHSRGNEIYDYGDFNFSRDFKDLFKTPQTNTFLVKANYWWNL